MQTERYSIDAYQENVERCEEVYNKAKEKLKYTGLPFLFCLVVYIVLEVVGWYGFK